MRSAVITGGGTGIGLATALRLHGAGFALSIVGRRREVLDAAVQTIAQQSGEAAVFADVADVADPDAAARVVDQHVERTGGIDTLVAAAGAYELREIREITPAAWDATADVHVRAAVLGAAAAARHMVRAGRGRIVLLSSVNGLHSEPGSVAYSAAKAAIISVARSLAVDLAGSGVTANAVAPGWVTTPMTQDYLAMSTPEALRRVNPLGRAGTADEIANVISYLVLDAPEFLTGATIVVDGGQTAMAPLP
jgi:NAD(P)-dependent dehydrogenase (short-subunit alcohol dehydrogenase family)